MVQVAKNRYTSDRFHDFIGFEVAKPLLERAFLKTYGMPLNSVMGSEDMAIGTFRRSVSSIIPAMTRVAPDKPPRRPGPRYPKFRQEEIPLSPRRVPATRKMGPRISPPGFGSRVLAFILRKIPKIGPASALDFKVPTTRHRGYRT